MVRVSKAAVLAACAAVVPVVGASGVAAVASAPAPAKDSFVGNITAASGSFAGDHGGITIVLAPSGSGASRRVTVTLRGRTCAVSSHCIQVSGKLTGTLTRGPIGIPDAGSSLTVRAAGTVRRLGRVVAAGTVHGTGFIMRGRETLKLKLTGSTGSITITADSGFVPGGTSP